MIDLLENILTPGGRARISPYIQDAQLQVLFGKTPEPHNRHDGIRSILAEHEQDLQNLSETYIRFAKAGRQFIPTTYQQSEFLKLYLAYYLTTNVSKIQLCLIDLVRANKILPNLKVIDIGVGAGTTAIAILDFMLAWMTASHLAGKTFPVKSLAIESYDISPVCLEMAEKAVNAFSDAVCRRKQDISCHEVLSDGMNLVVSSGQSAKWVNANVSQIDLQISEGAQVLLFASNVLTELSDSDKVALESRISGLPSGSIATIIVSGDKNQCGELNTWKAELLSKQKGISSLFPCGEGIVDRDTPCKSCWNSRRESLHEPLLYRSLRDKTGDPRSFNEYSNNLLSWSYSCLELKERDVISECPDIDDSGIITRILGKFWRKKDEPLQFIDGDPDAAIESGGLEFIKLCPLTGDRNTDMRDLWARRLPGHVLPSLSHGSKVKILNGQARETTKDGLWIIPLDQTVEVKPYDDLSKRDEFLVEYTNLTRGAIDEISFRLFGFPSMRPFQHEILSRVLTGHNILGIAATGGGKSECYILPAMLFSGVTIVVSPLKSLMQDQFEKRIDERYGLRNLATYINGEVPFKERQVRLKRLELGYYKIAYFTPEQLRQSHVLNAIKRANDKVGIRYLALDEAHCISQWGHDFRDSYLNLVSRLLERGINPVRIALTATASPEVRVDLCDELGLKNAPLAAGGDVYIHSSNRVELNLIVKTTSNTEEKSDDMVDRLQSLLTANRHNSNPGAAIVFMPLTGNDSSGSFNNPEDENSDAGRCSARVSDFASFLERKLRQRVAIYHGKMDFDHEEESIVSQDDRELGDLGGRCRKFEQTAFIDGQHSIMVATKGFGMGIDKPNIRLIIHRSPTANLEAYAQEAGRAGRDGQISDVVLYYSPDSINESGAIRSDHKIQDFFLSQKYICREDVVAMRKFLSTADREINGHLYFTSDEIIPFFDHLESYSWPDFPPRLRRGKESREHSVILDSGYEYSEKVRYIDRILSVLYRIRPSIGSSKRVCLVSSYQESGAVIIPRPGNTLLNPNAIVGSNEYFGELLRSKAVDSVGLRDWISKCTANDTVQFARFLGLSISETASMLWDINRADGKLRGGKWESTLLDFSFIAPPKYGALLENTTLPDLRGYKGAAKRASYSDARKRASNAVKNGHERETNNNGEIMPSIDDWFGWWELPSSKGWEILPGAALKDTLVFDSYLDAFMNLHDRRQANDREAYNLLLTDYVGINSDGTLRQTGEAKKCLRDVLLGYLKTGEVVQGGNCRSCSSCAPNGNFETSLEERSKLVVSLGTEILAFLESLEKFKEVIPIDGQIQQLWEIVKSEEAQGRSLNTYIEGWTGRLLTDSPGHLTASWIRVDGMVRGFLPVQTQEICTRVLDLLDRLQNDDYIPVLWGTIDLLRDVVPEMPESLVARAKACQRLNRIDEAQSLWLELLNMPISKSLRHMAHSALFNICKSGCHPVDSSSFNHHGYEAARTAPDFKTAVHFYAEISEDWQWEDVCKEYAWCVTNNGDFSRSLLEWWLNQHLKQVTGQTSSLSTGGLSIIKNLIGNIAGETSKCGGIEESLAEGIIQWCEKLLGNNPSAFHIRALKMILMARYGKGLQSQDADLLAYLNTADNLGLQDLLIFNEAENVFSAPYVPELLQAELAYRNDESSIAESHWGNSMDSLPQSLLDMVGDRILSVGLKISKSANYTIPRRFHSIVLGRLDSIKDWDAAVSIFRGIAPEMGVAEVLPVFESYSAHGPIKMLDLIDIWSGFHRQTRGTHKIIEFACNSFNKVISGITADKFATIISSFHPYEVVTFDKFDSLKIPNFFNRYLERCSADCLLVAYKNGIIDKSAAEKYDIGSRLLDINAATQPEASEADASGDSELLEMKLHYLLNEYRPQNINGLFKWLRWLDTYKLLNPELLSKLPDTFDHFLTHASTRSEYDQSLALFMEYAPDHLTEIFHLIKATVDIITDIEGKTSIHLVESLDKDNLALLAKTMADVEDTEKADVYIAILRSIRARTKPGWKTPLVRLVEFLVSSGRGGEAELIGNEPDLSYGKKRLPFKEFVQQFKGELRSRPENDAIVNRVTDAYVRTWLFCAAPGTSLRRPSQTEQVREQKYEIEPRSSQYGPIIIRRKKDFG